MSLWPKFHTSGAWEVTRRSDKLAVATLRELGVVDEAMCATLKGWIIGLISLAGVKEPHVEHVECRARGFDACVYHVTWS
jgi:predicted hydrocarbon binding protein